jgi:hypothetical protein
METPISRNKGQAQQVAPCEPLTANSPVNNVVKGQGLDVSWANGHTTGVHTLSIAAFGSDTAVADFTTLADVKASATEQPQHHLLPASTFSNYAIGSKYTLRYSWSGYDNCATLRIVAPTPSGAVAPGNVTKNPVTNAPLQEGDYLLKDGSATVGVYNTYSDSIVCAPSYTANGNQCVKGSGSGGADGSGMTPGGKAALSLFIIALVGVAAFAGFSYYSHGDALHYARGRIPGIKPKQAAYSSADRASSDYAAYKDPQTV